MKLSIHHQWTSLLIIYEGVRVDHALRQFGWWTTTTSSSNLFLLERKWIRRQSGWFPSVAIIDVSQTIFKCSQFGLRLWSEARASHVHAEQPSTHTTKLYSMLCWSTIAALKLGLGLELENKVFSVHLNIWSFQIFEKDSVKSLLSANKNYIISKNNSVESLYLCFKLNSN